MESCEIYAYEKDLWVIRGGRQQKVEEGSKFVEEMYQHLSDNYPEALSALMEYYSGASANVSYFRFLVVRRFCKCNFSILDNVMDIDHGDDFHFEHVPCPLRGECKLENIVCHPQFCTCISKAEMRVLKMVYEGVKTEEIADRLFLSVFTVKNHIKNAYKRLGIHSEREFMNFAKTHNLFNN